MHPTLNEKASSSQFRADLPVAESSSIFQIDMAVVNRVKTMTAILVGGIALYKCRHIVASVAAFGAAYWLSGSSLLQTVQSAVRNIQTLRGLGQSSSGIADQVKQLFANSGEKPSSPQGPKNDSPSQVAPVDSSPIVEIENIESDDDNDSPNLGQALVQIPQGQSVATQEADVDPADLSHPIERPELVEPDVQSSPIPQENNEAALELDEASGLPLQQNNQLREPLSFPELDKYFAIQTAQQASPILPNPYHVIPVPVSFPPLQGPISIPQPLVPAQNGLNVQPEPLSHVKNPALSEKQKPSNQENSEQVLEMVEMYLEQSPAEPEEDMYSPTQTNEVLTPNLSDMRKAYESLYNESNPFLMALKTPKDLGALVSDDAGAHFPKLRSLL